MRELFVTEITAMEKKIKDQKALLKQIFSDITKDNRLSPDTYKQLIEVVK